MAIGAGWQAVVAYVNIACYYVFGIPLGLILGYKVKLGVKVSTSFSFRLPIHDFLTPISTTIVIRRISYFFILHLNK